MKRVVFGLVGAGCLFAAAVAISQTSVLVAKRTQWSEVERKSPNF